MNPTRLHGDVDTPRPLRAVAGEFTLKGWCLLENLPEPPPVRLATANLCLPQTTREARDDVPRLLPGQPAAAQSGFTITGRLPAGVHLARLEAQSTDGTWQTLTTLCIAAESSPFAAGIDSPVTGKPVTQRVHVEGWALHPRHELSTLSVRYGHQEIPCNLQLPRTDVPAAYPDVPHAARSGFKSRTILSAGRGPVRLRARLADGTIAIARTKLEVAVATDENHHGDIDFGATRISLPSSAPRRPAPVVPAARALNLLFILPGSFAANSALHVSALANELAAMGHSCAVAVPHDVGTLSHHLAPAFRGLTYQEAAQDCRFPDGRAPDVLHAWTTRENVRRLSDELQTRHHARLVVHLEDNEQQILALTLGRPFPELARLPAAEIDALIPADLSHPHRSREFLNRADGVTVITDRLREFVPPAHPCLTLWPAADARYFSPQPVPSDFRRVLGLAPGTTLLFYHGNVHAANAAEVRELYAAVARLNESGHPVTLLRTGLDRVDFLGPDAARVQSHVIALGQIHHHHHLPPLMALADIFVQPGLPDEFNDYRFPSKLPEFFALGRPVILPRTNLGTVVRHGTDAYVLDRADAAGITRAVQELRTDRALADRLAAGALAFAAAHFNWRRSAEALANFHAALAASRS